MQLKPGLRLRSAVGTTEVIILRAPSGEAELTCEGAAMVPADAPVAAQPNAAPSAKSAPADVAHIGERYVVEELGLEILCTKQGSGEFSCNEQPLVPRTAKPLPSTD